MSLPHDEVFTNRIVIGWLLHLTKQHFSTFATLLWISGRIFA